jgi:pimeloyl-ACP methyl ester carboxylesterase
MLDSATVRQAGYIPANGLQLYYQIHGSGRHIVLLHGGLGTVEMFATLIPGLAQKHRVVVVELQGHGHTADVDRPLSFEQMADDVATLIRRLCLGPADVAGYSLGGGVALQIAIRHPDAVRSLVVLSAPFRRSGWYPEVRAGMGLLSAETAEAMAGSPIHAAYVRVAPEPANWPVLVAKTGELLRQDYDWSERVCAINAPALIVAGDRDSLSPAHAFEMFTFLGGGSAAGRPAAQLAILPGATHSDILAPGLAPIISAFVSEQTAGEQEVAGKARNHHH